MRRIKNRTSGWLARLRRDINSTCVDLLSRMKLDLIALNKISAMLEASTDIKEFTIHVTSFTKWIGLTSDCKYGEFHVGFSDQHEGEKNTTHMSVELYLGNKTIAFAMEAHTVCDYVQYVTEIQNIMYTIFITIVMSTCKQDLKQIRLAAFPDALTEVTPCNYSGELYSAEIGEVSKVIASEISPIPDVLQIN